MLYNFRATVNYTKTEVDMPEIDRVTSARLAELVKKLVVNENGATSFVITIVRV